MSVARNLLWNYSGSAAQFVFQLGYTAVTARLVAPEAFGAYAIATTVIGLLGRFAGAGVATCLLRAERITRSFLRAAATLAGVTGVICAAGGQLIAPLVAHAWGMPQAEDMLRLLALQFLVQPGALAATAALRRLEHTNAAVRAELIGQLGGSAGSLAWLLATSSPYALALNAPLTSALTLGAALVPLCRIPIPAGAPVRIAETWGAGSFFTGYGLVQYLTNNAPLWVVSTCLGPAAAGQFSRAALLGGVPLTVLGQGLNQAAMPEIARVKADGTNVDTPARMASAAQDVLCAASAAGLITLGAFAGVGPALFLLLLGPGWASAAPLMPLLTAGAALTLILYAGNTLNETRRDPRACVIAQLAVIAATAGCLAAAWAERSLLLCAAACPAGPAAGLIVQHLHWRHTRVLPLRPLMTAHAVHATVAAALALAGWLGSRGVPPARGIVTGCVALLPVVLVCAALRSRLPVYVVARRHGLLRGSS